MGATLVEPDNEWTQRLAGFVDQRERAALRGDSQPLDPRLEVGALLPKPAANSGRRLPERFGVVLEPAFPRRRIAFERLLALGDDVSAEIERERPHALRAAVDRQQKFVGRTGHDGAPGTA